MNDEGWRYTNGPTDGDGEPARLREENARLRARLQDWEADFGRVMMEPCSEDEKHCTCVPALRAEVARLRAALEQAREANQWIPVSERLPNEDECVLIVEHDGLVFTGWQIGGSWLDTSDHAVIVTHWRPLPEPPDAALEGEGGEG